ncbi:L-tyrosine decarboxylase [Nonlabens ulvanivorans]|uniref:L-tyrosine decarboxylase n=1 Tax=Nonlabens ulvanivorans TaxID=906888 RepID=A0A090WG30_NONUL|nr:pyridoxal-dependent decarboxylase [Nonlabens ulvanivorans]GAL74369.1 L-tyrosine decarboxylase [Nonlabens ulvanivorans]
MTYNQVYKNWKRLSKETIDQHILEALSQNINYYDSLKMGVPASHLDKQEFAPDSQVLDGSTFLKTLINNPNHIGVHTDTDLSEPYFSGTQRLEAEVIKIIAEDILKAQSDTIDGYVSSGGTEGNIQAIWVYRNLFNETYALEKDYSSIAILCSEDAHYSMDKASNLLNIKLAKIKVDSETRAIDSTDLKNRLEVLQSQGVDKLILVCNMMTTMFGSVDSLDDYMAVIAQYPSMTVKVHVDGAYGGFFLPFTNPDQPLTFNDDRIDSFTLDAHKMLQAPYGTGIFVIRKGLLKYSLTDSAQYVAGMDCTLVGSRSGANAISIYKILMNYGPYDWAERMLALAARTTRLKNHLLELDVKLIHFEDSNIITIHRDFVTPMIAVKYGLVPDNHNHPEWFKIVVMDHVKGDKITQFLIDFKESITVNDV